MNVAEDRRRGASADPPPSLHAGLRPAECSADPWHRAGGGGGGGGGGMTEEDENLTCKECGEWFCFTAGQQRFHASKGIPPPTRCPDCKLAAKKDKRDGEILTCRDCKEKFCFTVSQQKKVDADQGLSPPTRCFRCNKDVKKRKCSFCENMGHVADECRLKKGATCKGCGVVGGCDSRGFAQASGRNNVSVKGCECSAARFYGFP